MSPELQQLLHIAEQASKKLVSQPFLYKTSETILAELHEYITTKNTHIEELEYEIEDMQPSCINNLSKREN